MFPVITHIDQVKKAIEGRDEFIIAKREGYLVVNYMVALAETFPDISDDTSRILRECRGLVFCSETGKVISRRLNKFFNVGERSETSMYTLPWDRLYIIMDKLDGSMVTPIPIKVGNDIHIRWGTKMGITGVAMQAEEFVATHPEYEILAKACCYSGYTPIFEWCTNQQRIVIDHPEDKLILLHIRDTVSGLYLSRIGIDSLLEETNTKDKIPLVKTWDSDKYTPNELVNIVRNLDDAEGIVVQFHNGNMVKIKSDWYVRIHRAKDKISSDRRILECVLAGEFDDLIPILPKEDVDRVITLERSFNLALEENVNEILGLRNIIINDHITRKEYALTWAPKVIPLQNAIVFKNWDNPNLTRVDVYFQVLTIAKQHIGRSETSFEEFRKQIGF